MSTELTVTDRHLDEIHKRHDRLLDLYDRTILTLSGGALVLSVTFIGELADGEPTGRSWLGWSWFLLVVSILAITFSYVPSVIAHEAVWLDNKERERFWGTLAWYMSIAAGVSFAVGLAFLARFAFLNM